MQIFGHQDKHYKIFKFQLRLKDNCILQTTHGQIDTKTTDYTRTDRQKD